MRFIFPLLALAGLNANARWLTMQESGSVVEKFHVEYSVAASGAWTQTIDYAVRVQAEDAKSNVSTFPIEYNAFTDQVEVLEAYTLNQKTKIPVEPAAIEDRDKGESKDYDVMKVRSIAFPQVQIGSVLNVKYRVKTSKPVVDGRWSTDIEITPSYFIESFKLSFRSEVPLSFEVKDPRKLIQVVQVSPKHIEVRNRQTLPGWVQAEKDVYFHPQGDTQLHVSTHSEWAPFLASLGQDYERILGQGVPAKLKPWVDQAKAKATNAEKIKFLLEKMSVDFRYFGDWRRHNGGIIPRPLQEIEKSRYGDCKDLSALMTSMLRALNLEAGVALIRRGENPYGEEPDYKLPSINRFNHAIVYVKDGNQSYWLDPTNPVGSLQPFSDIAGRPAWVIGSTKSEFVRTPAARATDYAHVHDYEYRFTGADSVKVKVNAELKNLAPFDLANDLMLAPKSDVLSDTLDYFSEGQDIKSHKYLKEPETGRELKDMNIVLEYEAGRVGYTAGKSTFWVIPDGFLQGSFYETDTRESDIELAPEPYTFQANRRLKQTRLAQEPPEKCVVDSEWMQIGREVTVDGDDVVIKQTVALLKPYITKSEFRSAPFKKLQDETKRCFYRTGLLIEPVKRGLSSKSR